MTVQINGCEAGSAVHVLAQLTMGGNVKDGYSLSRILRRRLLAPVLSVVALKCVAESH